jgi:hypothetical protein
MATDKGDIRREGNHSPHTPNRRPQRPVLGAFAIIAAMIVIALLVHFFVAGLWHYFEKGSRAADAERNPILSWTPTAAEPARLPPEPRLQPDPVGDLHRLRAREDEVLQTYGWVDQKAGVVRIPVARAMQQLAERGALPSWPAVPPPATQTKAPNGAPGGN